MKKLVLLLGIAFTTGLLASTAIGVGAYGLGFVAPQIMGRTNVSYPVVGEIVYDANDGNFYGYKGSSVWVNLSSQSSNSVPTGTILPFGGKFSEIPDGYLPCYGQSLLRTDHPELFAVIDSNFGSSDSDHFNLPDLQGRFMRGTSNETNRDPDASGRLQSNPGGNAGDNVGSLQDHALQGHWHNVMDVEGSFSGGSRYSVAGSGSASSPTLNTGTDFVAKEIVTDSAYGAVKVSSETRPKNVNVSYIIKY